MAITATDFVASFPEFEEINELRPEAVTGALLRAQAFVSTKVWGERYEQGVFTKAAHLLCMTAFGENARIKGANETSYGETFKEMLRALPIRTLVSGGTGGC